MDRAAGVTETAERIRLCAGDTGAPGACATVDRSAGGRIASLVVHGHELLVTEGNGPYAWGAFPMVPYAGRIRRGELRFRGRTHRLPITMAPHAIHGTLAEVAWEVGSRSDDSLELSASLGPPWPFRGRVTQRFRLEPAALGVELRLDAEEPMPASMGWHPWFARRVAGASGELELFVEPGTLLPRDAEGIPTGRRDRPGPRPWDDTFTDLPAPPRLRWPGLLQLRVESDCRWWVIYDEQPHGLCVEPQTAPPDAPNWMPDEVAVEPGRPLTATMTLRWGPDSSG